MEEFEKKIKCRNTYDITTNFILGSGLARKRPWLVANDFPNNTNSINHTRVITLS